MVVINHLTVLIYFVKRLIGYLVMSVSMKQEKLICDDFPGVSMMERPPNALALEGRRVAVSLTAVRNIQRGS